MDATIPCTLCKEGGHRASKCPELNQPEKVSGGGGGDHSHDDDDEKITLSFDHFALFNKIEP